jgi:hypothetical protein
MHYHPRGRDTRPYFQNPYSGVYHLPNGWSETVVFDALGRRVTTSYEVHEISLCGIQYATAMNVYYLLDGERLCKRCAKIFQRMFAE